VTVFADAAMDTYMEKGVVTICVINYKTLDLTRLCLENIRRYTHTPYKLLVIDNDSQDASTAYLASLPWIQFVSRTDKSNNDGSGGYAHAAALDLGVSLCETEFFMSLHSDTIVHRDGWLAEMVARFKDDPAVACVGGGKCHLTSPWRESLKKVFDYKMHSRKLFRVPDPTGRYRHYNRTICTVYRTEVLKRERLSFLMDRDQGYTAGRKLYFEMLDRGYRTVELSDRFMRKYVWHVGHATQVINKDTEKYPVKQRTCRKTQRILEKVMSMSLVQNDDIAVQ
jgi:cellulose synthase/poly-beta-1,6-N-acetylglucosamine synthase-like glycosyltransferase